MNPSEIVIFLVSISIMLFGARSLGELVRKVNQPIIVGEILAGILLGPTLFGTIAPETYNSIFSSSKNISIALSGITNLAVIMLLLVSGLEVDLSLIVKQGKQAALTSIMGIVLPFAIGFGASYLFPYQMGINNESMKLVFALFIGTALSISALPVIVKTLIDLNIFKTQIGFTILASAMVDDLAGWIIFSIILSMLGTSVHHLSFEMTIALTLGFIAFTLIVVRKLINYILPIIQEKLTFPGGVLNLILILGFLSAAFTEYIGIHAIFGAFIMGIAIGDSAALSENTREIIHQFVTNIFAPLFLVSIGLRVNFIQNFDLVLVLIFIILAFAGKLIGCGFGAYWGGANRREAIVIGFGMNSKGAMEIILGLLALEYGLIQEKVFVALVIMALVTSISSAPLMNMFLSDKSKYSFSRLLNPKYIFISDSADKFAVITELVNRIEKDTGIDKDQIISEVWEREKDFPTGIANSLAIPHARIDIKKPVIAVAYHTSGIDFGALDGIPSRVIVLLLTPKTNNELQLKLLAEIAATFRDKERSEEILTFTKKEEFASRLLKLATLSNA